MIRTLLVLTLLAGCNHKNLGPSYAPSLSELQADLDGDGIGDLEERARGLDPFVANVPDGSSFDFDSLTLRSPGRADFTLTGKLRGNLHPWLLQKALKANTTVNEDFPFPAPELSVAEDVNYWAWRERGARATTIELNGARELPAFSDTYWAHPALSAELTPRPGYLTLRPYLSAEREKQLLKSTYRLILSTPTEDRIYYIHPELSPDAFLRRRFELSTDQVGRVLRIGNWASSQSQEWRTLNLPGTLEARASAGATYALVFDQTERFRSARSAGELPSAGGTVVVYYPEVRETVLSEEVHEIHRPEVVGIGVPDISRRCNYTVREAVVQAPRPLKAFEALRLLAITRDGQEVPLAETDDVDVLWVNPLEHGTVLGLQIRGHAESTRIGLSPAALTTANVGIVNSDCRREFRNDYTTVPLWVSDTPQLVVLSGEDE